MTQIINRTGDPLEHIRQQIAEHEKNAARLTESADEATRAAAEHKTRAEQWRKILRGCEENSVRTVTVKLEADVSGFIESMGQATAAARRVHMCEGIPECLGCNGV